MLNPFSSSPSGRFLRAIALAQVEASKPANFDTIPRAKVAVIGFTAPLNIQSMGLSG